MLISIVNLKLYIPWFAVGWRLGMGRLEYCPGCRLNYDWSFHVVCGAGGYQGMYNFRFTILINTNNTSNYQSTNETHYTQENTTITMHKGSQLLKLKLKLIETCYQLQPSDKKLHTKHTPLRTIILH